MTGEPVMVLIRPALLMGRVVDFWRVEPALAGAVDEEPSAGYWRDEADAQLLAATEDNQTRRWRYRCLLAGLLPSLALPDIRLAEEGRPAIWTSRLFPVPLHQARSCLARLATGM